MDSPIRTSKPTLWHCHNSRSLRALWAMEELDLDYDVVELPFPPRFLQKEFLGLNSLGTVPYFIDGDTHMTESSGICHYLVERYRRYDFGLKADHPEFGDYLNWLYHSDATLTFPQTVVLRYTLLEPEERRLPQAAKDYGDWYIARLRRLNAHMKGREYLCDERFTMADIAIGYALLLGELQGFSARYTSEVTGYLTRLKSRPAFIRAQAIGGENSNFKKLK
ncbi:MAG: glutathione S-transferase family protein [Porticoccaceae bacterium]|nr:glutathione S-transferase family protein [Porticoccaceae bacterium]MDG1473471.1 glutathione S-transferase family protein [Porticoccaceae bacterium]